MREQNDTAAPRWLIVSYYANVDGRAASHHVDDRLAAFAAAGISVTVLSSTLGARYQHQQHIRTFSLMPSAILDELKACRKRNNQHALPVKALRVVSQFLAAVPLLLLSIVERLFLKKDKRWSWQFTAWLRGWVWSRRHRPDLILTTGGPASAHMAGRWLTKNLGIPLVCEFQDPLPYQYPPSNPLIHAYHLALEAELSRKAKALVFLTEGAVEAARERIAPSTNQSLSATIFAVASGAPANPMNVKATGDTRVLAHIGTLSGTRNLRAILTALTAMSEQDDQLSSRFKIRLAGTLDKEVLNSIDSFVLKARIEILGRRPRGALDAVVADADVLLLIQNTGPIGKETIPSKAYEYLQTGRPILGLIDSNTQLRAMLEEHGHSVYDFNEDSSVLQNKLTVLLNEPLPEIKACRFTVEHSVNELVRNIESVL